MKLFSGTHFEIGFQIGQYYARHGVEFSLASDTELFRRQLQYYVDFAPELVDELRGIAAGGDFAFADLAYERLVSEILFFRESPARSCSIGGFTDRNGRAWVARNYDWHPLVAELFQTWKFTLPDRNVIAISDMCIGSPRDIDKKEQRFVYEDAINSDGLYVGMTYAHCAKTQIGLTTTDMIKLLSWRCKTVHEALNLFSSVRLSCPKNYFIADSAANMAVVEHAVEDMHIRTPDTNGVLVLTNHYTQHLNLFDLVERESTTFARYSRLEADLLALVHSDNVDFSCLDKTMSNPASPVCQFWPAAEVETVWTLLLDLKAQNYQLIGNPRSEQRMVSNFIC